MKQKKMLMRILALALGLCLCFCIFAGCSNSTENNNENDNPSGGGEPPEKPDGDNGNEPPEKPNGEGGGPSSSVTYTAVKQYTSDVTVSAETISSTGVDENAVLISESIKAVFKNVIISRQSSSSTGGDNSSFYGVGAALLATNGKAYINGGTISTDAAGGAGAFAYGDGVVYIKDTVISTKQDTSGGIHAAGGGTLYAWDLTVTTEGNSSAAIRSDRGGGTMVVDGGSYTSNGTGSPAVYCTADIAVNNATLTANNSEGICIEGLNSLYLFDCNLTSSMKDDTQNDTTWGVIVYQSMSGDAEQGNSTFQMAGGSLKVTNGGVFYTTNTESHIYISDVTISTADDSEFFLRCTGNKNQRGWGSVGSNGASCTFTADKQQMNGDVIWDSVSTLDFYIIKGSALKGAAIDDESCAGNGGSGYCNVYIDSTSTWTVTGDSVVTNLYCAGKIVDENGNTVTVKDSDGNILVNGTGSYSITVTGKYSTDVDTSGADTGAAFDDFAVSLPEELTD